MPVSDNTLPYRCAPGNPETNPQARSNWALARRWRGRKLPQRNHQSVEVGGDDQSGLAARQRQHCAVLVGQYDPARAGADCGARAGSGVYAIHVGRTSDVADRADKIGRRGAEGESLAHPADRERIAPSVEQQRATAAGAAHDKPSLDNIKADAPAVGVCGLEPGAGDSQSDQCGTNGG